MPPALGQFEHLILLALLDLPAGQAYGVPIRELIEERTGRRVSAGAVYTALSRLQAKGFVSSRLGDPTPERGGRSKRLYHLETDGARVLAESVQALSDMSLGVVHRLSPQFAAGSTRRRGKHS